MIFTEVMLIRYSLSATMPCIDASETQWKAVILADRPLLQTTCLPIHRNYFNNKIYWGMWLGYVTGFRCKNSHDANNSTD